MLPSFGQAPSLTRRVMGTVLAAFFGVFVVLLIIGMYETMRRDSGELDRSLLRSARGLAEALDTIGTDAEAAAALELVGQLVKNTWEPQAGPALTFAAARLDGRFVRPSPAAGHLDLLRQPDGVVTHEPIGLRLYVASSRHWKVAVVDDRVEERSRWLVRTISADLAYYLALALPIVLLPVWWSVRTALKPLRRLSQQIAQRSPHDLSPLASARTYRELQPLEAALNRLFERVAQGLAREKAFVHDAAHEMRTPLAVVATQAEVLSRSVGPARDEAHQRLQAAVTRASHLTQQLLDLARADTSGSAAATETVDMMNLARDAMSLLAERAAAQGTELELIGPDHAPLSANPRAMRSIIDNLLDNALRYGGPAGQVTLHLRVEGEALHLRVADTGPGIASADRERIFERFWRSSTQPGTGLGLAIVRQAARAMGGEAWLDAAYGPPGAALCVRVPRRAGAVGGGMP